LVVTSRWSLQRDERGRPCAILEINRDITEKKRAEDELQQTRAELVRVNRIATIGEMTASIAHEINQPLAAMVTNASACVRWLNAQTPNLDEARQTLARIAKDGKRAGEVIGRIRVLVNKTPPRKELLNINDIILEVIHLGRNEIQKNRVALDTRLSRDLPLVFGDRIQLQQVVLNLLANAIEAVSEVSDGPRNLLLSSGPDGAEAVLVTVRDSGAGLALLSPEQMFEPFYTTKPEAMGMGLAISRSIIEAHGGRLWATPNDGRGASFQFSLPAAAGSPNLADNSSTSV
jgi:two-component system sensor kinase FixL